MNLILSTEKCYFMPINPEDFEEFAKENPQQECYESKISGVRFLHESRVKTILHLISKAVNSLPMTDSGSVKLIDIGCGDGYVLKEIIKNFPSFNLIGIDLSETRLKRADKSLSNVAFIKADVQKIPLNTGSFDIAVCTEVIEHIPYDVRLLQEIYRILNRGKFLILTTPNLYTFERIALKIVLKREVKISIPDHLREYSWRDISLKIRKVGFSILSFQSIGFYIPYMRLFFKSKILTRLLFYFSSLFPKWGRIFVILAKKKRVERHDKKNFAKAASNSNE
jgi:ubiquinone/menaquinone biosynthesis C-methylase UbiE